MKGKLALLALAVLLSACSNYNAYLRDIPEIGFDSFEYHRVTGTTSADIVANGASLKDGQLIIEHVSIAENFGPIHNFNLSIKNYRRVLTPAEPK